jgi:deoxyribonuclease V
LQLAFDTYYYNNQARTVGLVFDRWEDDKPLSIYTETLTGVAAYTPGEFYKRELPCILSLCKQINLQPLTTIIVDGYVFLDDSGEPGLGAYLYQALENKIPVIGVAKTNFARIEKEKQLLYRGQSRQPLYITATGTLAIQAASHILSMHGEYRIPTLLKMLDKLTKENK